jgi:hypothetical protein
LSQYSEWLGIFDDPAARAALSEEDLEHHDRHLRLLFDMLDTSEDGRIDFREFIIGLSIVWGKAKGDGEGVAARTIFRVLAGPGDVIGKSVFETLARRAFPGIEPTRAGVAFDEARGDKDAVDEAAFVSYMKRRSDVLSAYRKVLLEAVTLEDPTPADRPTTADE